MFPSPFGVEGISTKIGFTITPNLNKFPSPFGVEGISTVTQMPSGWIKLHRFPSPFGVEGISTEAYLRYTNGNISSFRLRLEWKVFQHINRG